MTRVRGYVVSGIAAGSLLVVGCGQDEVALPAPNAAPILTTSTSHTVASTADGAPTTERSIDSTPAETPWVPPSITSPTVPYTLPPDYGAGPPITRDVTAPPRPTYAPDAILPPVEWVVDDTVTVQFTPPSHFRQDPRPLNALQDYDRANGLFVLERWRVPGESTMATLSVQTNPGDESPLLSRQEFPDTIVTDDLTWYLWNNETVEQTGRPPNMALAVTSDHLFIVSGTRSAMQALIDGLAIQR